MCKERLLFEAEFSSRPPRVVRVVVDLYSEAIFSVFVASAKQTIIEDVFKKEHSLTKFLECNDKILVMDFWVEKIIKLKASTNSIL